MKKIFICLLFTVIFSLPLQAFADNYLPKYSDSVKYFGEGVFYAPNLLKIYQNPDENSQIIEIIQWDNNNIISNCAANFKVSESVVAFIPDKKIVLFAVIDENKDWCKIIFNQKSGESGWVKISENAKFVTWRDLFNNYGRKNGLYLWNDTPKASQVLRTTPDADVSPNNDFLYPRMITMQILRGNWMLLKVIDYDRVSKVGWFQWRTPEGRILLFPALYEKSN
jgi:hypothetical protein